MLKNVSESLAERVIILNLYTFTFLEKYKLTETLWVESYLRQENLTATLRVDQLPHSIYTLMWEGGI